MSSLHVAGISPSITKQDLEAYFAPFGAIVKVVLPRPSKKVPVYNPRLECQVICNPLCTHPREGSGRVQTDMFWLLQRICKFGGEDMCWLL